MRTRIGCAGFTCLGRAIGTSFCLDNNVINMSQSQIDSLNKILKDFIYEFDSEPNYGLGGHDTCDFGFLNDTTFCIGYEPSYQCERLLVFQFDFKNKENSVIIYGTAFGPYGSNIAAKRKYLKDYKRKSKLTEFFNKWYDEIKLLFEKKENKINE